MAAGTAIGPFGARTAGAPAVTPPATAPVAATAVGAAGVATAPAPVRLYFEVGQAVLPADATAQLAPLAAAARASGRALVVSGYHDASGNASANAELAKQRAFAVRDLLVSAGVRGDAIELAKPIETLGGADAREARRVEVSLR
jgi:outer membrane protein OmpA-like peptidoglycan-associated protein